MKCHRCGYLNHDTVRFCSNCGTAPGRSSQQGNKGNAWKWVLGILGICILLGVVSNRSPQSNQPSPAQSTTTPPKDHWESSDAKIEAFVMSQRFMKKKLKAPATAEFPSYSDSEVSVSHRGGGIFAVKSYVDAQNSFGANLRTHYVCELKDNGKESWSLISLVTP